MRYQCKSWPELVKAGLLTDVSDSLISGMVEDFKQRHRGSDVDVAPLRAFLRLCPRLGGNYDRYSCDNSSPNSIIDQMINGLTKARQENHFVPWSYVFCDYSVSGLKSSRQGYSSYKHILSQEGQLISTTYVDDFSRASRDEIEWWRLAYLSKRFGKRMIGASDGFDLSAADWDLKITFYGLLSRLFIKDLRGKVKRGMRGAARRRTCLGRIPLGFARCVDRDELNNIRCGPDGLPIHKICVDPETRQYRQLMYALYTQKLWSVRRIAKHFNELKVEDWNGWTAVAIRRLLWSATAVGVFKWNQTRREFDREEEKWLVRNNPRIEWEVYYDPNLAIDSMDWWKAARKRLAAGRRKCLLTGRKPSRNRVSATTLFSGTLFCGYCGRELLLNRSAGKNKLMACPHGSKAMCGCQLSTSKNTRIIEECLLGFLADHLFSMGSIEKFVMTANSFLAKESRKPPVETKSITERVRTGEASKRLFKRIESQENEELCQAYDKQIAELQKEVNRLRTELRAAEAQNMVSPAPLDLEAVKAHLGDLRAVLNQEIPAAAEAIRALTGPIKIRQERQPGQTHGAIWIASFTPDFLAFLCRVASMKDCPEAITLGHLCKRNWIIAEPAEIRIKAVARCEQLAEKAIQLEAKGLSITTIAAALGTTWSTARDALICARSGLGCARREELIPKRVVRKSTLPCRLLLSASGTKNSDPFARLRVN